MHAGQLALGADVVRRLVDSQFPQWRELPVVPVPSSGTVNALFRLGDGLVARFPLVGSDVGQVRSLVEREAAAAGELLGRTRFPTPAPVAIGDPGPGYPLPWSVQTWVPGTPASEDDPGHSVSFAEDLAQLVAELRALDVRGRSFSGTGRGGRLADHDPWVETSLRRSEGLLDPVPLRAMWARLRRMPRGPAADVMSHGDLMPGNVLARGGRLAGVIDVGGLGPADPALDLVGAWHLLEGPARSAFRSSLGVEEAEWERGAGWAFQQAMGLVWYYADSNPVMAGTGRRTLERLLAALG